MGDAVIISAKPNTPQAIKIESDRAQIKHSQNTYCCLSPCFRTKAFWAPIATIRPLPIPKPLKTHSEKA